MLVEELMGKLSKLDPKAVIHQEYNHMEQGKIVTPVRDICIKNIDVRHSTGVFIDAFDYGEYETAVVKVEPVKSRATDCLLLIKISN